MRIFGLEITRAAPLVQKALAPVDNRGGWFPIIRESFAGAFQRNVETSLEDVLQYWAMFRCISIISGDIAKMRVKLVERQGIGGIWSEIEIPEFSRVLAKPNHTQTRIQFFANWMESKLIRGNAYALKQRDASGRVVALFILDPERTVPLVSDAGEVFYQLTRDNYVGINIERTIVPASEIIHDRWNTLFHPLVGLSPIYATAVNALVGLRIEQNTARLFQNGARPSGVLTAPGAISNETASRVKEHWDQNFTGENAGKVAVLGDGLTYAQMTMSAVDAQLIEQLRWNDTIIAGCFGVPAYMINAGNPPAYNNVEALNQQYYSQALQTHIEAIELCLDEGLGLTELGSRTVGVEFDTDNLLRMDTNTKVRTAVEGLKGLYKPDEVRAMFDLPPVPGGDAVYLQQQNFSIEALAKRDAKDDPFATPGATADPEPSDDDPPPPADDNMATEAERALAVMEQGLTP